MYKLYWHPWSSSYAPMAVLEELGVKFDLHEVDYDGGETRTAEYLRIQPLGLIPALKIGESQSMFESAAIIMLLCDRHQAVNLAPRIEEVERPSYLQWMLYLADTLYPSYNRYYHPDRYTNNESGAEGVKKQAMAMAAGQWQVVEDALASGGPWLLGERFSACDIYLQMITTWHEKPTDLWETYPNVRELAAGVTARKGCQRAIERHNFQTGFSL